ncbi:MAG TPA: AI-2E family transporter [Bryobacteraceae bacterium]|nr:AI-2E family transporter [Bryobacteraceae bacterium]
MTRTSRTPLALRLGPLPILALAIAGLYFAREVLIPFAFALTLTLILSPAVSWLSRIHISRAPAVLTVMLVSMGMTAGLAWIIASQLVDVANELPNYRENIKAKIAAVRTPTKGALGRAAASVQELGKDLLGPETPAAATSPPGRAMRRGPAVQSNTPLPVEVVDPPRNGLQYVRDITRAFIAPVSITGIVVIFTVFMLLKKEDLRNRLLRLVGLGQLTVTTQALDDATQRVSRYLLMQFLVNAAFGLLVSIGLYFIGVPYAVLWGTVGGLLRLVPYVGTLVAGALPLALSMAVFNTWAPPLLVLGLYVGLELITGNLVEPWLYGVHTGISSLAILVSAVFWTLLWGPAGLILSTPLTVCLLVLGRYSPQLSFLHILLGDEPVLEPQARLYQRLLAMDQVEAQSVVDVFLKEHPLNELYDSLLIPALTLAEQDRHRGAIDAAREEFLFLNFNEMIADLSTYQSLADVPDENGALNAPTEFAATHGRILCVAAHDQADEITAGMLGQFLERRGSIAIPIPVSPNVIDVLRSLRPVAGDLICISALPPYAFTPARKMYKQIRARYPKVSIAVGAWGFTGDPDKAKASFERTPPDQFFTSFLQVAEYLYPPAPESTESMLVEATD